MTNPANIHAFFSKLSNQASAQAPSLSMLHSSKAPRPGYKETASHDMVTDKFNPPVMVSREINDYGVGLPPLAHC